MFIEIPYFEFINNYKLWILKNSNRLKKLGSIRPITFKIYDGIPNSSWNGGRIPGNIDIPKNFNVSFAMTNHHLNLDDEYTIDILKQYDIKGNTLIISDYQKIDQLRKLFKNYQYILSITAFDLNKFSFDDYSKLEIDFDFIVPRVEIFNNDYIQNFKFLNKQKYLILYSFECSGCPLYTKHYEFIGNNINDKSNYHLFKCWFKNLDLLQEAGFDKNDYNYSYQDSSQFNKNIVAHNLWEFGGIKIGRNNQPWEKIQEELEEIISHLERMKNVNI